MDDRSPNPDISTASGIQARGLQDLHLQEIEIFFPDAEIPLDRIGGKAATLARLGHARARPGTSLSGNGLPGDVSIPAWFAVAPPPLELPDALTEHRTRTLVDALRPALVDALTQLVPDGEAVAVRSSAVDEDSAQRSFAGQYESFLNVAPQDVPARVVDVWRSGLAARVPAYRRELGADKADTDKTDTEKTDTLKLPAVLIQRMIVPDVAGVAFSADPVSGRRGLAVVSAVEGLADRLVAGEVEGDTYAVNRACEVTVRSMQDETPLLDAAQTQQVADLARRLAAHFGRPQDIEWAIAQGQLFLLQSRPITTLAQQPDPDGALIIWDNSNIIESYGGTTTPLTYSFARRAYTDVYQTFCRVLGVDGTTIGRNQHVFANMIGLVQGRIYYNLLNWYRVLAMLPGFRANRHFMEQMMGVKEGLPETVAAEIGQSTRQERLRDNLRLARSLVGLVGSYFGLERRKRAFLQRLEATLGTGRPDLSLHRPDELVAYYRRLEAELLPHWDAPLVNDFFAMIFFGLLRKLCVQWLGDSGESLQNNLLVGEGGMISAEPAARVRELARLARVVEQKMPGFLDALAQGALVDTASTSAGQEASGRESRREFDTVYAAYLERFGDRCMNELKLESATLFDDPTPLLRSIGQLAQRDDLHDKPGHAGGATNPLEPVRAAAQAEVARALSGRPLRRWVFGWVLRNARARVRDRENLRFERTRVFGRARQIFRELGARFFAVGALDEPRDVFYLQVDEVLGFVEGTATSTALSALARTRKAEFARYAQLPPLDRRFVTSGAVHIGNTFQAQMAGAADSSAPDSGTLSGAELDLESDGKETRQGMGACPGVVRGRARVVENPLDAQFEEGDILVAAHTDPSWILIMPLAAGLLVERGSLLSHAAIVARELGIPAVVSISGVMEWLQDGDWVELDGATGRVQRVQPARSPT